MLNRIFNPDNFLFRGCSKILDIVLLSLLWLVLCLPIFTAGPATTALYYTVVKCIRRGEESPYKNFFGSFKSNFKVGAITTAVAMAVGCVLVVGYRALRIMAEVGDSTAMVVYVAYSILIVLFAGVMVYLFPVLSRFTLSVGGLSAVSFKLALKHLPSTLVMALLNLELANLCIQYWVPVLFLPALGALLNSLFLERIFKKYSPAVPASDTEDDEADLPWYLK